MSQSQTTTASPKNLGWLWGLLVGLAIAVLVGLGVYFFMVTVAERAAGAMADAAGGEAGGGPPASQGPPPTTVKVAQVTSETMYPTVAKRKSVILAHEAGAAARRMY